MRLRDWAVTLSGLLLAACGGNECKLDDPQACGSDRVCEVVTGEEAGRCFAPVQLEGTVFDLETDAPLAGARVSAVDINGAPASRVVVTDDAGHFVLRVPTPRSDVEGTLVSREVTLRAAAHDHVPFPSGLRPSLPIDLADGARADEETNTPWIISGPLTEVGLSPVEEALRGLASVSGKVEVGDTTGGALVVAEGAAAPLTAVADLDGSFTLFNVSPGAWTVSAYQKGQAYETASVSVEGADLVDVDLAAREGDLARVTGTAKIVAGSGVTTVVLAVESTFNALTGRGEIPPGLRAPESGKAPSINGAFEITGVPPGRYVVLAGYENDGMVRDPDPNIAGTQLQRIVVDGADVVGGDFKVTSAVVIQSPGAEGLDETSATPTFRWAAYPSARSYELTVFDARGNVMWGPIELADTVQVTGASYDGEPLQPGGVYQWRLMARGNAGNPISLSEDLKGVFRVAE